MLKFNEEVVVRIWLHGETHAACTIRTMETPQNDIVSSHISWFPNHLFADGVDGNKHVAPIGGPFENSTARPAKNYAEDRLLETHPGAQRRHHATLEFEDARREAREVLQHIMGLDDYYDRKQYVDNKIFENEFEHNNLLNGFPNLQHHKTNEWHELYAANLMSVMQTVQMRINRIEDAVPFPEIQPNIRFDLRKEQVVRDGVVLTSAAKYNLPGLGAQIAFTHVKGARRDVYPLSPEESREKQDLQQKYGTGPLWGLNLKGMASFWNQFVSNDRQGYQFASRKHNCCGVVTEALLAGGMGAYINVKKNLIYRNTAELLERVTRLQAALDELNAGTQAFVTDMRASRLYDQVELHGAVRADLWPWATFQQNSRSPKKLGLRREQVATIDSHLKAYHAIGWSDEHFNTKLEHLVVMMRNVLEHRRLKPRSDRRKGVDSLGLQIVKLLNAGLYRWAYMEPLYTYCSEAKESTKQRIDRARQVRPRP